MKLPVAFKAPCVDFLAVRQPWVRVAPKTRSRCPSFRPRQILLGWSCCSKSLPSWSSQEARPPRRHDPAPTSRPKSRRRGLLATDAEGERQRQRRRGSANERRRLWRRRRADGDGNGNDDDDPPMDAGENGGEGGLTAMATAKKTTVRQRRRWRADGPGVAAVNSTRSRSSCPLRMLAT